MLSIVGTLILDACNTGWSALGFWCPAHRSGRTGTQGHTTRPHYPLVQRCFCLLYVSSHTCALSLAVEQLQSRIPLKDFDLHIMAAEPISLATSILALTESGFSLGKTLLDALRSYQNAQEDIAEISHEVNVCSTLMRSFGERLMNGAVTYSEGFQEDLENLVENVRSVPGLMNGHD